MIKAQLLTSCTWSMCMTVIGSEWSAELESVESVYSRLLLQITYRYSNFRLPPNYRITAQPSTTQHTSSLLELSPSIPPFSASPFDSSLMRNDRLTDGAHFQDVRLIRLDISRSNIKYVWVNLFIVIVLLFT